MKPTVFNSLRHLRITLGLSQKEMSSLAGCTRHTIESLEMGRLKLSTSLGFKFAQATGVDYGWLMANDEVPIINNEGLRYDPEQDFRVAQEISEKPDGEDSLRPHGFYRHVPEMKVIVAGDLLVRVLQRAHKRNSVPEFIHRLEWFIRSEISKFGDLQEEVYTEIRKHDWPKGGFLFPRDEKVFLRQERRAQKAQQAFARRKEYVESNESVRKSA
jgi:transcriptional regulator with XRE-family HTH domain